MPGSRDVINGRYEVQKMIACGGTSRVYLVTDRHIGRVLAMKVMDRKSFGAFRFAKSEIESLRAVHYPLFPGIHDAFCDEDSIYILSEYVKGTSLAAISRRGGLPRHRSLMIAERICEALIYLHGMKKPLLYLDLKPENVIISDDGSPHLIDFGIAGWLAAHHMPVGTPGYSPPEQYRRDAVMDERTDIFAFGMTYYAIRCGVPPDSDPEKALEDIIHSRTLCSSERSFLKRCCALSIEDRYTSAGEVLRQIRHISSIPEKIKRTITVAAVAAGMITAGSFVARAVMLHMDHNEAARELVEKVTEHMEEGQYTPEGIRILKAYIGSGRLSRECEQEFIFEVAMNSLLVEHDYKAAAAYFSRLDEERFPEVSDYKKLCRIVSSFGHDPDEAAQTVGRLFSDISGRAPSKLKYENMIFVADCLEKYDRDHKEGIAKAVSVLKMEQEELAGLTGDDAFYDPDEISLLQQRIAQLISVKEKRLKIKKTGEKNGNR
ncbi:MAG: serine/threonine protein kinase [Lachnospiraceae bacterium]|nr:serine/threonine protein kinase [Lachnospiraceae bacterium]